MEGAGPLCLSEGFATGASIHEATNYPVAVAFNAGNLGPVAHALQARFPNSRLIVCADDDAVTDGNPGLTAANDAVRAVAGLLLAVPEFGSDRDPAWTDFNDLTLHRGREAVRRAIAIAKAPAEEWPDPQSLDREAAQSEPYPLDALPEPIQAAVKEVQGFTKAPMPLVASAALGAVSIATQAHIDVKRAEPLSGPSSLSFLCIADSGERKTTCDGFFMSAIREYEQNQAEDAKPELKRYAADIAAWTAERDGILLAIKETSRKNKDTKPLRESLAELSHDKPEPPRVPKLLRMDNTPESLAWVLAKEWPSAGVASSDAGIVFGSHGMGKDSIMRNLAQLNPIVA